MNNMNDNAKFKLRISLEYKLEELEVQITTLQNRAKDYSSQIDKLKGKKVNNDKPITILEIKELLDERDVEYSSKLNRPELLELLETSEE